MNLKPLRSRALQAQRPPRRSVIAASAHGAVDRTAALRRLLAKPGVLLGPAVYDGLSARLTEEAGFDFAFSSGFSVAAGRLGKPDTGLLSYAEMLDQGRSMHEATVSIPIIGDGDTGYGNAMNVKRTVAGYALAGFAGILIEDQKWPKSCGHVRGKRVVGRAEAVARVRAACDARDEGRDIVVVARTDARQGESFKEAMYRAAAFAEAGADCVFVDALESVAEMRTLCAEVQGAHKMANMLEGGKTPILSPAELSALGFKLCAYPLSLLGVTINAQRRALEGLKEGRVPVPPEMPTFEELQAAVGFPAYFEEEARYAVVLPGNPGTNIPPPPPPPPQQQPEPPQQQQPQQAAQEAARAAAVEPDAVMEPGSRRGRGGGGAEAPASSGTIDLYDNGAGDEGGYGAPRQARWLRVKISDATTGQVKLETRFPAGFLNGAAAFIPQVAGVDLESLVRRSKGEGWAPGQPVLELDAAPDTVAIYLEFE